MAKVALTVEEIMTILPVTPGRIAELATGVHPSSSFGRLPSPGRGRSIMSSPTSVPRTTSSVDTSSGSPPRTTPNLDADEPAGVDEEDRLPDVGVRARLGGISAAAR